jgi:hypothetical protein
VFKLSKALYGLKQAPRAWYECLRDFLIANSFKVGVGTPNQRYPLLQYEDAVPIRRSLAAR